MLDPRGISCRVVSASPAALALAATASDAPARIHSVFRSAVNVETPAGLLTLATAAGGGLPNGILLDTDDLRALELRPGWLVGFVDGELRVPRAGVVIDLRDATRWWPGFPHRSEPSARLVSRWRGRSAEVWRIARTVVPRGGLRSLYWPDGAGGQRTAFVELAWVPRARRSLDELVAAIARRDRDAASRAAGGLIGLGDGATPSGDDALVGVEAGLHAMHDPSAGFLAAALGNIEERTTVVAATFLRHASRGEFAERLHQLVGALLDADDRLLAPAIARAVAWGASSGADGLLGVLRALDAATGPALARRKTA